MNQQSKSALATAAAYGTSAPDIALPESAAVRSEARVEISAPAVRIWQLLSEIERWPKWNPLVQQAAIDGPFQPGSVIAWRSKGFAVRSVLRDVAPGKRIAWTGKSLGTRAVHTWRVEEAGPGIILTTAESLDGWLPKLLPKAMKRMLDETLLAWLKAIKEEAERST